MANTSGDLLLPQRDQISPAKNKENWMVDPTGDSPEHAPRKWVQIDECPFGEYCTSQSWKAADVWSLESPAHALKYLCQHYVHSSRHNCKGTKTADDGYQAIAANFHNLKWSRFVNSFEDRKSYVQKVRHDAEEALKTAKRKLAEEKAEDMPAKKRRYYAEERRHSAEVKPSDSVSNVEQFSAAGMSELAAAITGAVKESVATALPANTGSSSSWDTLQSPVATSQQPALQVTPGALPGTITMVPSAGSGNVTIPVSKLVLIQESLQRAEHAVSSTLSAAVSMSQRMASERAILINAINTVSQFTGQAPKHFVP